LLEKFDQLSAAFELQLSTKNRRIGCLRGPCLAIAPCAGPRVVKNSPVPFCRLDILHWRVSFDAHATLNGDRCFAAAGLQVWSSLLAELRQCNSLGQFKWRLKTHFFGLWDHGALWLFGEVAPHRNSLTCLLKPTNLSLVLWLCCSYFQVY